MSKAQSQAIASIPAFDVDAMSMSEKLAYYALVLAERRLVQERQQARLTRRHETRLAEKISAKRLAQEHKLEVVHVLVQAGSAETRILHGLGWSACDISVYQQHKASERRRWLLQFESVQRNTQQGVHRRSRSLELRRPDANAHARARAHLELMISEIEDREVVIATR